MLLSRHVPPGTVVLLCGPTGTTQLRQGEGRGGALARPQNSTAGVLPSSRQGSIDHRARALTPASRSAGNTSTCSAAASIGICQWHSRPKLNDNPSRALQRQRSTQQQATASRPCWAAHLSQLGSASHWAQQAPIVFAIWVLSRLVPM